MTRQSLGQRFEAKTTTVVETGCKVWHGATGIGGYGVIIDRGKHRSALAVSLELASGHPTPPYARIRASCGNPTCVAAGHLVIMGLVSKEKPALPPKSVRPTANERFDAKTEPSEDGCINWIGFAHQGYGYFSLDGKSSRANRYALRRALGRPIAPGLLALHKCHNSLCVNPEHLYEGTCADNTRDKFASGRQIQGQRPMPPLTASDHAVMLWQTTLGLTQRQIFEEWGVCQTTVTTSLRKARAAAAAALAAAPAPCSRTAVGVATAA